MKIKNYENIVRRILEHDIEARNDDFILYLKMCHQLGIKTSNSMYELMIHHKEYGLPAFETVSRCRRKLQKQYEWLGSDTKTVRQRQEQQDKIMEYISELS